MAKIKLFQIIGDIWKHGLNSKYIEQITESSPFSNWLKGTTGSGLTSAEIQQNDWNAEQSQVQRDWTEMMDNTKYQRQVNDMASAGLNPAMMYGNGVTASTPSGSAASGGDAGNPSAGLLDSVLNIIFARQRLHNLKLEGKVLDSQTNKNDADAELARSNRDKSVADTRLTNLIADWYPNLTSSTITKIDREAAVLGSELVLNSKREQNIDADTALKRSQKSINEVTEKWLPILNKAKSDNDRASALAGFARAAYDSYVASYLHGTGMIPGTNTITSLAAAIISGVGLDSRIDDSAFNVVMEEFKKCLEDSANNLP